jgi:hypothetical protein
MRAPSRCPAPFRPLRLTRSAFAGLCLAGLTGLAVAGCEDDSAKKSGGTADAAATGGNLPPPVNLDLGMDALNVADARPLRDIEPDFPPEPDFPLPDLPIPDVPPPLTDLGVHMDFGQVMGPNCDPRLRAAACDPGFYCVHEPDRPEFVGHCAPGEGCTPGDPSTCPDPARPYCHLMGGATFCTEVGVNRDNDDCVDREQIPQACAEGLVCSFSTCRQICNPDMPTCAENWRCESYEGATAERFGICQPPACDWFTARGCEAGEKCAYSIRGDGQVVGSCLPLEGPGNGPEAPCGLAMGGDNCAVGLVCTGPPNSQRFCKVLCDTGGYQAPCPDGQRCVEALATANGPVRGLGICITNQ